MEHEISKRDADTSSPERSGLVEYHIPSRLQKALPKFVRDGLRNLKALILTRDVPRHVKFEQSAEDALASASMSIIVPIHDAPEVTRRCLASLEKYARRAQIILVDDASKFAETVKIIDKFSGRNNWTVIRHAEAVGHSLACNEAARLATNDFICLLNSDTVITPWVWTLIRQQFLSDPHTGVAGPSTSQSGNSQALQKAAWNKVHWNDNQVSWYANQLRSEPRNVSDLPWASGFAFFIRRKLWEELKGFDENLPDYGNEKELCGRVNEAGYRCVWVQQAYIHHVGRQSYGDIVGDDGINDRVESSNRYIEEKRARALSRVD